MSVVEYEGYETIWEMGGVEVRGQVKRERREAREGQESDTKQVKIKQERKRASV